MIDHFVFESVESAVLAIMPSLLHQLRTTGNHAGIIGAVNGVAPEAIEEDVSSLIHFVESHDFQRELEAEIIERGVIDLRPDSTRDGFTIDGEPTDKLTPLPALRRLYSRWAARPANADKFITVDGRKLYAA